jgi:hydroxyacylglutathione hydrolase
VSSLDVRSFALGMIQTNAYMVRADAQACEAVVIDPGDEPRRLLDVADALGVRVAAILITHCHFDHIGAVAPLARATGAPVYCPAGERALLSDIATFTPPGFGPFESHEAEHTLAGGERLALAGLEIEVLSTPGHSPAHLTYAIRPAPSRAGASGERRAEPGEGVAEADGAVGAGGERAAGEGWSLFSGDVLFQGSVGRVDLPGGDWAVLAASIGMLLERFAPGTRVYPGHMGATTLGRERDGNPFLVEMRADGAAQPVGRAQAGS